MKVVIIAGGKGGRLKPLTDNIPKPMVKVNNKPILLYVIEYFKKQHFFEFIITLCYKADAVKKYFGDGSKFGVKIEYTLEDENNPLGTAGGIGLARDRLKEAFIVTCGDVIRNLEINSLMDLHKRKQPIATMAAHIPSNEFVSSILKFNQQKKLVGFIERPTTEQLNLEKEIYMNSSLYFFEPAIFNYIPCGQFFDFGYNLLPTLLTKKQKVYVLPTNDFVVDLGTHQKLKQAKKWLI